MSIFDTTTKLLITMAAGALTKQLDMVKAKHSGDHRVVDAITAAEAAINGALQGLLAL